MPRPIAPAPSPATGVNLEQFKIGFRIAVVDCSDCHAIDQKSKSPEAAAPPLRELLSRYNAHDPASDLVRAAAAGKGGMPIHTLNRESADALIAYLRVISAPIADHPLS